MTRARSSAALLLLFPAAAVFSVLYLSPLVMTLRESLKVHESGSIGGTPGTWTLANYYDLMHSAYGNVLFDTFFFGVIATLISLIVSYPLAYYINGVRRIWIRKFILTLLVAMLFSGGVVRVYAIALAVGPAGFLAPLFSMAGISPNAILFLEVSLIIGLMNFTIPIVTITLLSAIKNIDMHLEDAAQTLGAPRWVAFFDTTFKLSIEGLISASILSFAICVSAFVVPMILGRGIIVFATNLIFSRFAEVTNHPSGAAIAIILLLISVTIIYGFLRLFAKREQRAAA